jgi:predicted nucleic acid-binding protein
VAVSVTGKVLIDRNVFIDYLRTDLYADWIFGAVGNITRFLSSVVLMELRIGPDTPRRVSNLISTRKPNPRKFESALITKLIDSSVPEPT